MAWRRFDERDVWLDRLECRTLRAEMRRGWEVGIKVRRGPDASLVVALHVRPNAGTIFAHDPGDRQELAEWFLGAHKAADEIHFHEPLPLERGP